MRDLENQMAKSLDLKDPMIKIRKTRRKYLKRNTLAQTIKTRLDLKFNLFFINSENKKKSTNLKLFFLAFIFFIASEKFKFALGCFGWTFNFSALLLSIKNAIITIQ